MCAFRQALPTLKIHLQLKPPHTFLQHVRDQHFRGLSLHPEPRLTDRWFCFYHDLPPSSRVRSEEGRFHFHTRG